jgi:hypothetical protein
VPVPAKRTVKFKVGRLMKMALEGEIDLSMGDEAGHLAIGSGGED